MTKGSSSIENLKIVKYDDTQKNIWDEFVRSNPCSWTGHLSGMFALEKETAKAENYSLMVFDEKQQLLALLPLFLVIHKELRFLKRRILNTGTHLASGPLLAINLGKKQKKKIINLLMSKVDEIGKQVKADEVTIGYPNIIDGQTSLSRYGYFPLKQFGYKERNVVTMIKDLGESEEDLFASIEHRCRKSIRKCSRYNVMFQEIQEKEQWLNCYDLNIQTLGVVAYSKKALEIIWDEFVLQGTAIVTAILHQEQITNVLVSTGWRDCFYFWIGFNSKTDEVPGGSNMLLWETMLFYKQKDFRFCEVGSMEFVSGKRGNISRFKESFNGLPIYMLSGTLELCPVKCRVIDLVRTMRQ